MLSRTRRRTGIWSAAAALVAILACNAATAQESRYPTKPIRWVVNSAPGSPLDVLVRKVAETMDKKIGGIIIVENKPGAAGTLGANEVIKAPADGYTILISIGDALISSIAVMKDPPYEPRTALRYVSKWVKGGAVLVANSAFKPNTMQEMIDYAKSSPEPIQYGTQGQGTFPHYDLEALAKITGAHLTPVHYRGPPQSLQAVLQGEVTMTLAGPAVVAPQIAEGKLKAYAVQGDTRVAPLPGVPTFAETGLKDFVFRSVVFVGMFMPAQTPDWIIDKWGKAVQETFAEPSIKQYVAATGYEIVANSPGEFEKEFMTEDREITALIKQLGIRVD